MLQLARILALKKSFKLSQWTSIIFWIFCFIAVLHVCLLLTISDQNKLIQLLRPFGTCSAAGMLFYTAYLEQSYKRWAWICHGTAMICAALFSYLKISQGASIIMTPMRSLWVLIYLFSFVGTALYLQRRAWWIGSTWRIIVGGMSVGMSALIIMQVVLPRTSSPWPWTIQANTVIPSLGFDTGIIFAFSTVGLRHRNSGGPLIPYVLLCLLCLLIADTLFFVLSWMPGGISLQAVIFPLYTLHSILLALAAYRDATHQSSQKDMELAAMPLTEWILWTLVPLMVVVAAFTTTSTLGITSPVLIIGLALVTIIHEILSMLDYRSITIALHQARLDAANLATSHERSRIAHDLHDVTNYYMALVIRKLNRALRHFDTSPAVTRLEVTESITHIKYVLADTRALSFTLSNGSVQPLPESIRLLAPDDDRLSLALIVTRTTYQLPDNIAFTAYRITQEAFTNVIKHAPSATQIAVTLAYQPSQLSITITDNGDGTTAPIPNPTASGLLGMQERVEQVGGTLVHGWTAHGYRIRVNLPRELTHDSDSRVDCG